MRQDCNKTKNILQKENSPSEQVRQEMALFKKKLDLEFSSDHHEAKQSLMRNWVHEKDGIEDEEEPGGDEVMNEHEDDSDDAWGYDDSTKIRERITQP